MDKSIINPIDYIYIHKYFPFEKNELKLKDNKKFINLGEDKIFRNKILT